MVINTYLSKIKSKNNLSKQEKQKQNHGYGQCFDGCQMGGGYRGKGKEAAGLRSTKR